MKYIFTGILFLLLTNAKSQDLEIISAQVMKEGLELYRNELASWISTDSLSEMEKEITKGYFTYSEKETKNLISVYVDTTEQLALKRFSFEQVSNTEIRLIKVEEKLPLSNYEKLILSVRNNALSVGMFWYKSFGYLEVVNPNVIIHKTEPIFKVYIIPGPFMYNIVPIGGDLYLTFKKDGTLINMDPIHNNLIPFNYDILGEIKNSAHEHKGKKLGKRYITPTDICTLLLYKSAFGGEKHLVIHKKFISEFYFNEPKLLIRVNDKKTKIK